MNQIIYLKKNCKGKLLFIIQLTFSMVSLIILIIESVLNNVNDKYLKNLSNSVNKNINIVNLYKNQVGNNIYLGTLYIEKINIKYIIFNNYSDDLLKLSLCKFCGVNFGEEGNICIVGHNYENNEFFSNLYKLQINDEIMLEDLYETKYKYLVYEKKEINPYDMSILKSNKKYELTLITCNNANKKRLIIKAYLAKE